MRLFRRPLVSCIDANVLVGECGLDYARTQFCDKETQMKYFLRQLQVLAQPDPAHSFSRTLNLVLQLAKEVGLPLYLHSRDTMGEFCEVMSSAAAGDWPIADARARDLRAFIYCRRGRHSALI